MHDFVFQNPTKVIFGKNSITKTGSEVAALGGDVLLLSGQNSAETSGVLHTVRENLTEHNLHITEYKGISPDPDITQIDKGIQTAKQNAISVICAVGGGSVIDAAKGIAAGAMLNHSVWKLFTGKKRLTSVLPVVAIPTLAASGSEMNSGMVLSDNTTGQKLGYGHRLLFPKVAIMDPTTTFTVPQDYTAYGAVDILAHLLEYYMTTSAENSVVQDRYMEGIAENIIQFTPFAVKNPRDYNARSVLMWSAGLALNGISSSGLGRVAFPMHLMAHPLSALHRIPHGKALCSIIPGWLTYHLAQLEERLVQFIRRAFSADNKTCNSGSKAITILCNWFKSLGIPTCIEDLGLPVSELSTLSEATQLQAKIWRMGKDYPADKVQDILHSCYLPHGSDSSM